PKRLLTRSHGSGKRRIGRLMRQILLAGKESQESPSLAAHLIPNRAPQARMVRFKGVQDRLLGDRPLNIQSHLRANLRQITQVHGQNDADHERVCTSTATTAGRSRTIAVQLSPESAEA